MTNYIYYLVENYRYFYDPNKKTKMNAYANISIIYVPISLLLLDTVLIVISLVWVCIILKKEK